DIVTGIVQRMSNRNAIIDLGRIESVLVPSEQMPGETYSPGARIKVYITEVKQLPKGPQVYISRTHPGLLKRLFELEVPEIHDGIVEIKAVAREAGNRSKIAVYSRDPNRSEERRVGKECRARGGRAREKRKGKVAILTETVNGCT